MPTTINGTTGVSLVANNATINTPAISGGTLTSSTLVTPTISGTVTGLSAASLPTGSVIQVVYTTTNTQATYTRGQIMTPLTTSITPSSASSRIIVMLTIGLGQDAGADIGINVVRNGVDLQLGSGGSNTNSTFVPIMGYSSGNFNQQTLTLLDSPATTSAVTYTFYNYVNGVRTAYFNRRGADTTYACSSSVVLMEVK